jgi:hypothetical protein
MQTARAEKPLAVFGADVDEHVALLGCVDVLQFAWALRTIQCLRGLHDRVLSREWPRDDVGLQVGVDTGAVAASIEHDACGFAPENHAALSADGARNPWYRDRVGHGGLPAFAWVASAFGARVGAPPRHLLAQLQTETFSSAAKFFGALSEGLQALDIEIVPMGHVVRCADVVAAHNY